MPTVTPGLLPFCGAERSEEVVETRKSAILPVELAVFAALQPGCFHQREFFRRGKLDVQGRTPGLSGE
jgi:hypothetical protein